MPHRKQNRITSQARRLLPVSLIAVLTVGVLLLLVVPLGSRAIGPQAVAGPEIEPALPVVTSEWALTEAAMRQLAGQSYAPETIRLAPPAPQKDACLHCHIRGEETAISAPLARWTFFSVAGLVFAFGMYRSASIWRTRTPWRPLTLRAAHWLDSRYQISEPLAAVLNKPVPKYALRWWYCLGGITALLFAALCLTGIMLAFYYQPTPEGAYASIEFIETQVRFGAAVRAIHHWSANGMIVMAVAHMVRVFIMGAYKPPRELNWVGGMLLLIFTLAFGFTGYLLPWDQRAYWASTVGSEMAGSIPVIGELVLVFLRVGWNVTGLTLSRFYALHIFVLPIATLILMGLHFLMVRRQGLARPL